MAPSHAPANHRLAKLLDFGLPKPTAAAIQEEGAEVPTGAHALTKRGTIVGTIQYMAPEQLEGRDADPRTDIFAFGAVVHEMLTGQKAFEGKSHASLIGAIMHAEPPALSSLQPLTPSLLDRIIKKCLTKDPDERWQSAADVASQLRWLAEVGADPEAMRRMFTSPQPRRSVLATLAGVSGLVIAAGAWWVGARSTSTASLPVTRFELPVRASDFMTNGRNFLSLSPDERAIAYVAGSRINVRFVDRLEPVPVRGTEGGERVGGTPTFNASLSADGQWIGFWQDGHIKKVSVKGGAPLTIAPSRVPPLGGMTWREDGTILLGKQGRIVRVSQSRAEPETIASGLKGQVQSVQMLPDRRSLLYTLFPEGLNTQPEIVVRSIASDEERTLIRGGMQAQYVPTGHLVYFEDRTLRAVRFDLATLTVRGSPVPVVENITTSGVPSRRVSAAHVAISPSGTLAYLPGPVIEASPRTLVWVDRIGREEPVGVPDRPYVAPRLSPDGSRIGVTIRDDQRDVWIWDIARRVLTPVTRGPSEDRYTVWTRDGTPVVFGSNRGDDVGLWWQATDGTGAPEQLAGFPLRQFSNFIATSLSPDGILIVSAFGGANRADLWKLNLSGDRRSEPLLQTPAAERNAEISPNGLWMAYESQVAGRFEIHLRPFPDVNRLVWQVSNGGGSQPRWAPSGKGLFFLDSAGTLMSVHIDDGTPPFGTPTKVFDHNYVWIVPTYAGRMYDVSRDGSRFLMLKRSDRDDASGTMTSIIVVQNWFEELKRIVP